MQKIANSCEKQLSPLISSSTQASDKLQQALGISELTKENMLTAANAQRVILGLPPFKDFSDSTSLKDGMVTPGPTSPQKVPKIQALADIRAFRQELDEITSEATTTLIDDIREALNILAEDPALADSLRKETFYTTGVDLIESETCPFCDNHWAPEALKKHVQSKLNRLEEVARKRTAVENKIKPIIELLGNVQTSISTLVNYTKLLTPQIDTDTVLEYSATCETTVRRLVALIPLADTIKILTDIPMVPQGVLDEIEELEKIVAVLPEPTKQDAAKEWLTVAQERLEFWREALRKQMYAKEQAERARQVSDIYVATSDKVLTGIYKAVEKDFASLYGFANRDDEGNFEARIVPSMGKLGFDVDFYGRGFFPPGAYHSEGHQDSMGLCLYLGLMRYLQGENFTFAVLDDVLMSVDAGHRREVCTLLKREFPKTQFIMTTHDPIWLRHMRTESLIGGRAAVQFRDWSVDHGPTQWDELDVWAEIDEQLVKNDVRAAASLLRHYLEYTSTELCHRLRASVEFRGDAQYQLGNLFPPAITRMRKLFSIAKEAANSWNQKEDIEKLTSRESKFSLLADKSNAEQWQVNVAVHYNSWDNLGKKDFEPVVKAFRDLLGGFTCLDCKEYLRVSPDRESPEAIRCECGNTNINLCKKPRN